jgi:hypothetical protein
VNRFKYLPKGQKTSMVSSRAVSSLGCAGAAVSDDTCPLASLGEVPSGSRITLSVSKLGHAKRLLSSTDLAATSFAASATRRLCSLAAERIA